MNGESTPMVWPTLGSRTAKEQNRTEQKSAQLEGTPTIPPSYTRVHAVVWECGEGQTDTHTDRHTRHTDGRGQYTFRLGYAAREM